jgi:PAS domain-containing protein
MTLGFNFLKLKFPLPPAHRLARINYAPRTVSFALTFVVLGFLFAERKFEAWELLFATLSFLVYPHLAHIHARIALDSKQAELNNLYADSMLMGIWAAQIHFALWPTVTILVAIILNNAANGGIRRLFWGSVCFAAGAAIWGATIGYGFEPDTGPAVTGLSVLGILVYVSWVATILFVQNRVLVRTHNVLQNTEAQFRFVAENPGDMVSMLDPQGRYLYASSSHTKHFDPKVLESGANWLDLVHPGDQEHARAFLDRLTALRTRQRTQLRMLPARAPLGLVACQGSPVIDHRGVMTAIVLVTQNVNFTAVEGEG